MANKAIDWALRLNIQPTLKLVLFVLANRADRDTFECFPSLNKITKETSLGHSSVARALNELETLGLIQRVRTPYKSTKYKLLTNQGSPTVGLVPHRHQGSPTQRLPSPTVGPKVVPQWDRNPSLNPHVTLSNPAEPKKNGKGKEGENGNLLTARAELIRQKRIREAEIWEQERQLHRHSHSCDFGNCCPFVDEKRPKVQELNEIIEKLEEQHH